MTSNKKCLVCGCDLKVLNSKFYLRCLKCGFAVTLYGDYKENFYSNNYYGTGEKKFNSVIEFIRKFFLIFRVNLVRKLTQNKKIKILDYGCGNGIFLRLLKSNADVYGVELKGLAFEAAKKVLDINLFEVAQVKENLFGDNFFDVITINHVLEHVENLKETLFNFKKWIKKDGFLIVEVPNINSWQAKLFQDKWFHIDYPRHRFHFSPNSLEIILLKSDFMVIKKEFLSIEMGVFGLIQSMLNTILKPENYLYDFLFESKKRKKINFKVFISFFFTFSLLPFYIIFAFTETLFKHGAVIRYICRIK